MLKIIDTHHHLWDLENNYYPWLMEPIDHFAGDYSPICNTYLISDLHRDAEGLDLIKSVHVQAEFDHADDPVKETAWLQGVADDPDSRGMPNAIVGFADLSAPDVDETLARHAKYANMRGIRHMLNYADDPGLRFTEQNHLMADSDWRRGYRLLAKHDMSFDLQIWSWQLQEAATLAKEIPEVPIIVNHTAMPKSLDPGLIDQWRSGLRALAQAPQVSMKISGLTLMDRKWTVEKIRPFVLDTIEILGADRCMFASNFPVDKLMTTYVQLWDAYDEITSDFSQAEREGLFWRNAEKYYRI
ncbi:MAG: amidohydrolase family protein [Chloroflexi bacterium]|nr:amidohydrolase family protein [Chloroflexota bacterium]